MTPAPKRRWFAFSLRTFFVAVTGIGRWLGWNVHVVYQRKAGLNEALAEWRAAMSIISKIPITNIALAWDCETVQAAPQHPPQIPLVRRLLGDVPANRPFIRKTRAAALRTAQLFPEAEVGYYVRNHAPGFIGDEIARAWMPTGEP
jgi:hypothetical protein